MPLWGILNYKTNYNTYKTNTFLCPLSAKFLKVTSNFGRLPYDICMSSRDLFKVTWLPESGYSSIPLSPVPFKGLKLSTQMLRNLKSLNCFRKTWAKNVTNCKTDFSCLTSKANSCLFWGQEHGLFLWWSVLQKELIASDGKLTQGKEDHKRLWPFSYINI